MITINEKNKTQSLTKRLRNIADAFTTAIAGGVNDAAENHIELTTQSVENMIAIDRINLFRAFNIDPATKQRTTCTIKVDERFAIPLEGFTARQTKEGVEVVYTRFGNTMLFREAFGPERPRLGKGIYIRITKSRFPIKKLRDLELFKDDRVRSMVKQNAKALVKEMRLSMEDRLGYVTSGATF